MSALKTNTFILAILLVIATGCSELLVSHRHRPLPPDWNMADELPSAPIANVSVVSVETNLQSTASPEEITDTNVYPDTWVALSSWGETNSFAPVEHIQPPSLDYSLTNNFRWRDLTLKG